jgi:hypothetical protein
VDAFSKPFELDGLDGLFGAADDGADAGEDEEMVEGEENGDGEEEEEEEEAMDEDVASRKRTRSVSPTTVIGPTTERPQKRRRRAKDVIDTGDEKVLAHPRGPLSRATQKRERKRARKVARNAAGAGAMDIDEWEGLSAFGI